MLTERAGSPKSTVTFQHKKQHYGSYDPTDLFQNLQSICTEGDGFCDDTKNGQITAATKLWISQTEQPLDATLTLWFDSEFTVGQGGGFVAAIIGSVNAAKTCQTHSWDVLAGVKGVPLAPGGTDTFCQSTPEVLIAGPNGKYMKAWVTVTIDKSDAFDWCSVLDLTAAIAGLSSVGSVAGAGLGFLSFLCSADTA